MSWLLGTVVSWSAGFGKPTIPYMATAAMSTSCAHLRPVNNRGVVSHFLLLTGLAGWGPA